MYTSVLQIALWQWKENKLNYLGTYVAKEQEKFAKSHLNWKMRCCTSWNALATVENCSNAISCPKSGYYGLLVQLLLQLWKKFHNWLQLMDKAGKLCCTLEEITSLQDWSHMASLTFCKRCGKCAFKCVSKPWSNLAKDTLVELKFLWQYSPTSYVPSYMPHLWVTIGGNTFSVGAKILSLWRNSCWNGELSRVQLRICNNDGKMK